MKLVSLFLLLAGAGATENPPAYVGALTFYVDGVPSAACWYFGSAFIYIMLIAGADAWSTPARGGALTFDVANSPSGVYLGVGSALSCEYPA